MDWVKRVRQRLRKLRGKVSMKPYVSVVVPAHNEANYIIPFLMTVALQEYSRSLELIIVDNNSIRKGDKLPDGRKAIQDDKTAAFARACGAVVIEYRDLVERPNPIATARNIGLTYARGELIVSTDADTIITGSHWIEG